MMQEMLQAKGVSRAFPAPGGGEFWALRGIVISIAKKYGGRK